MFDKLKTYLTPPVFETEEKTVAATATYNIMLLIFLCVIGTSIPGIITTPQPLVVLADFALTSVLLLSLMAWLRKGYVRQSAMALVLGMGVVVTAANLLWTGPHSPSLGGFTVLVIVAAMTLGRRAGVMVAIYGGIVAVAVGLALSSGVMTSTTAPGSPLTRAVVHAMYYLMASVGLYVAVGLINEAIERSRSNEVALTETLHHLQTTSFSKDYVDNILRSMSNLLIVLEATGKITTVNPALLKLLGYAEPEIIGRPYSMIAPHELNGSGEPEGATRTSEATLRAKDGRLIPIAYTQSMLRGNDGKLEGTVLVAEDITERRAAEAERLRHAMRYRALFEQTNDAVFLINLQGKYMAVNQRAADMLGYTVAELMQKGFTDVSPSKELNKSQQVLDIVKAGKTVATNERIFVRKDGTEFPVEMSVELVYDADGKPMHIQSIVRDITERKLVEQQLAYQARLLQNVNDAIISTTMDNTIQTWNPAAENVYGWKAEEVIGKKLSDIVPTEFESDSEDFIKQQYIVRGYWRSEVKQRARDGRPLQMLSSVSIIRTDGGDVIGTVTVNHDITARKQAENELQERIIQLAALRQVDVEINSSLHMDNVLQVALSAIQVLSNAEAGYILISEDDKMVVRQAIGGYVELMKIPSAVTLGGIIKRAVDEREPILVTDVSADPDYVAKLPGMQAMMVFPLMSQDHLMGVVALETSNREEFDQEKFDFLRILTWRIAVAVDNARLYQVSHDQVEELQKLYKQVSELEALKTDMMKMASHDLRNPVGVIKGYLDILLGDLQGRITTEEREYFETMRRSVLRMQEIISEILSPQRANEIVQSANGELVDMPHAAYQAISKTMANANRRRQTLNHDIIDAQCLVGGDSAQIREVMINLIDNAIKYTTDDGKGCIQVRLYCDNDRAIFEVEDNGFGIPEHAQANLFQQNYRVKTPETENIEGTGMGLYLVKNTVERNGGRMRFKSVYGEGSTFSFELPLYPGT